MVVQITKEKERIYELLKPKQHHIVMTKEKRNCKIKSMTDIKEFKGNKKETHKIKQSLGHVRYK
jgi:hypothetical protein